MYSHHFLWFEKRLHFQNNSWIKDFSVVFGLFVCLLKHESFRPDVSVFPKGTENFPVKRKITCNPAIWNLLFVKSQRCSSDCAASYFFIFGMKILCLSLCVFSSKHRKLANKNFLQFSSQKTAPSSSNRKVFSEHRGGLAISCLYFVRFWKNSFH